MQYEIVINIDVDKDANFLEVGDVNSLESVKDLINNVFYDLDDITVNEIEVTRR